MFVIDFNMFFLGKQKILLVTRTTMYRFGKTTSVILRNSIFNICHKILLRDCVFKKLETNNDKRLQFVRQELIKQVLSSICPRKCRVYNTNLKLQKFTI